MTRLKLLLFVILAGTVAVPAVADSAQKLYKAGIKAEHVNDLDTAYHSFKEAHDLKPGDPRYTAAWTRVRFYAGAQHIKKGIELRDAGSLQEALAEFRLAAQMDTSSFEALGQLARTEEMIRQQALVKANAAKAIAQPTMIEKEALSAAGPVAPDIKWETPISLHLSSTTVAVVCKTTPTWHQCPDQPDAPQRHSSCRIPSARLWSAMQSKTFWRPLSANTIMVAADTGSKRKELEQNVMKTFYLRNAGSPADLQQAAGTLKAILDISRIQVTPEQRSLTLRGTPDQMVLAQKLLTDIDKPKAEVVVDVVVMEVSRTRMSTIGTNPPTSASASISPGGTSGSGGSLTLETLAHLTAGDIAITIPGVSFSLLASDSDTKVIERPSIRVLDSEKASLKIGDRVPIATGSFQSGFGGSVNTQFQYLDVGVNVDVTPSVHAGGEVTLKLSLKISSVTGVQNIGGFN
jgi:general secretion pathway protein D